MKFSAEKKGQELIEAVFCQLNHHNRLQLTIQIQFIAFIPVKNNTVKTDIFTMFLYTEKIGLKCSPPNILVTKVIKHLSTTNLTWTDTKIQIMTVEKITVRLRGSTEGAHHALEYLVKITMIMLCHLEFATHKNVLFLFWVVVFLLVWHFKPNQECAKTSGGHSVRCVPLK